MGWKAVAERDYVDLALTDYQLESEKGAADGYASLNSSTKVVENPASASYDTGSGYIPLADTSGQINVAYIPQGPGSTLDADTLDGEHASAFADAAHAILHKSSGADEIKLDELGTPTDNTDLDVSTSYHGLVPKLPDDGDRYLNGEGNWGMPRAQPHWHEGQWEYLTSASTEMLTGQLAVPDIPYGPYSEYRILGEWVCVTANDVLRMEINGHTSASDYTPDSTSHAPTNQTVTQSYVEVFELHLVTRRRSPTPQIPILGKDSYIYLQSGSVQPDIVTGRTGMLNKDVSSEVGIRSLLFKTATSGQMDAGSYFWVYGRRDPLDIGTASLRGTVSGSGHATVVYPTLGGSATSTNPLSPNAPDTHGAFGSMTLVTRLAGTAIGSGHMAGDGTAVEFFTWISGTALGSGKAAGSTTPLPLGTATVSGQTYVSGTLDSNTILAGVVASGDGSVAGALYSRMRMSGTVTGSGFATSAFVLIPTLMVGTPTSSGQASGTLSTA